MIDTGLKGKTAIITGANNPYGIGAAIARLLASQGVNIFLHYYSHDVNFPISESPNSQNTTGLYFYFEQQKKNADEVIKSVQEFGVQVASIEGDLSKLDLVKDMFSNAEKKFGEINILVNNAADYMADTFLPEEVLKDEQPLWENGPIKSTISKESFERHFSVNCRAVSISMAEFSKRLIVNNKNWGRIVIISADCACGCPGEVSYRASKYALESYSRSAAAELGKYNITVNVVSPGPIQTGYISPEGEKAIIPEIPLRRVGKPEDIANAVLFFVSEQADWITGQLLFVHGGHRMALGQ
ncbi:MAG: SDR family oxidoreductase [Candidatus Helarchaeota archaeon]|nr:SDR family oxidoreductase [Candidatus Helarchaeota archaeon]